MDEWVCPECGSTEEPICHNSNGSDGITRTVECAECGYEKGW